MNRCERKAAVQLAFGMHAINYVNELAGVLR